MSRIKQSLGEIDRIPVHETLLREKTLQKNLSLLAVIEKKTKHPLKFYEEACANSFDQVRRWYYKVSKIQLNGSHIISENGIYCLLENIGDVNSYWTFLYFFLLFSALYWWVPEVRNICLQSVENVKTSIHLLETITNKDDIITICGNFSFDSYLVACSFRLHVWISCKRKRSRPKWLVPPKSGYLNGVHARWFKDDYIIFLSQHFGSPFKNRVTPIMI